MRIWIRVMASGLIMSHLYGGSNAWANKKDCPHLAKVLGTMPTDSQAQMSINTTDTLSPLDRTTRRACVIAGAAALVICYNLIPFIESKIHNYGTKGE